MPENENTYGRLILNDFTLSHPLDVKTVGDAIYTLANAGWDNADIARVLHIGLIQGPTREQDEFIWVREAGQDVRRNQA